MVNAAIPKEELAFVPLGHLAIHKGIETPLVLNL
jgi:hypothetical protein